MDEPDVAAVGVVHQVGRVARARAEVDDVALLRQELVPVALGDNDEPRVVLVAGVGHGHAELCAPSPVDLLDP